MYLLILILPLLGSCIAGGFGRFLGFRGAALVTTIPVIISALFSLVAFYEVALSGSVCYFKLFPWFVLEMFDASWGFQFDTLTVVMLVVITSVSSLVHLFSISYMAGDPHLPRFMCYLSIFTFFMLMLVTADNFLQMFFGWEGVGLASYLLINFWFTRLQASKASIKAMLVNRVGDFGLALGIMGVFSLFKTVDFATVFASAPLLENSFSGDISNQLLFCNIPFHGLTIITILLFIGAVGKSAQLGLHTWLPDAMEGPTPVSALIHAATMVTAGVFMIARCSPLFEYAPTALMVVTALGGMTCFFAATTGVVQNDLKRVIAYSTCSQLGYMVFACGLSSYNVGVFHLMNHAFFKGLLFLSAGSVIHALSDEQDMRKMGGTVQLLPFTYGMMVIGSLSLVGFPFLTGYYSKDLILEVAAASSFNSATAQFAYWLGSISVCLTSYYSFRLLFLTFLSPVTGFRQNIKECHDAPTLMAIPLILLSVGSIFLGFFAKDMMVGVGSSFWGNSIFIQPKNSILVESEYIPVIQKLLPLFCTLFGALLAYLITTGGGSRFAYGIKTTWNSGRAIYMMLNKRWFFDKVYNDFIAQKGLHFGYHVSFKTLDKGAFEHIGPYGLASLFSEVTRQVSKFQSGMIYHYAVVMLLGLTLLITIVSLWDYMELFIDNRLYLIFLITFLFALLEKEYSKNYS